MSIASQRVWKENGILRFIDLFGGFLRTYISYKQCLENNTSVCNYIRPFCDII